MKILRALGIAALTLIVGIPIFFAMIYAVSETVETVAEYRGQLGRNP